MGDYSIRKQSLPGMVQRVRYTNRKTGRSVVFFVVDEKDGQAEMLIQQKIEELVSEDDRIQIQS